VRELAHLTSVMEAAKWLVAVLYICSASAQGKYKWRGGVENKLILQADVETRSCRAVISCMQVPTLPTC